MNLETDRLILRRWAETDAESLYEYAKDPAVGPIAGWPPHKSIDASLEIIRNVFTGEQCYAICEKENGKAIGAIELKLKGHTDMTDREDECELGYWLDKKYVGKGYMTECANAIIQFAKNELNMKSINAFVITEHKRSILLLERLGFVRMQLLENDTENKGKQANRYWYKLQLQ